MITAPQKRRPTLEQLLIEIGEVGDWLARMNACEGAAGNISVCMGWEIDGSDLFPTSQHIDLPVAAPELAGKSILVTGSGTRLRDLLKAPCANLGLLRIEPWGKTALLFTTIRPNFKHLTGELNTHLVLHQREFADSSIHFNAVVHAQPLHITYLTNIEEYQDSLRFSQAICRWQPEMLLTFPHGIAFLPFRVPNSQELMNITKNIDAVHNLIVWAKHGVVAISNQSPGAALDLIEYAETGARYEYLNMVNHDRAGGLSAREKRTILEYFGIDSDVFQPDKKE
jgi:rhamnulose-1-phosphate aldolase